MIKMRPASLSLPKYSPRVIGRTTQGRSPCSKEVQGGSEGNRRGHRQRQDSIEHREPEQRARWGNIQAKPWKVPACLDRAQAEEGEWKGKKSTATGREEERRGMCGAEATQDEQSHWGELQSIWLQSPSCERQRREELPADISVMYSYSDQVHRLAEQIRMQASFGGRRCKTENWDQP